MKANYGDYYNLAERIENTFLEICDDVFVDLRKNDGEYLKMWRETIKLQDDFPIVPQLVEGAVTEPVTISPDEHRALSRYLRLKHKMENIERKEIYKRGHSDNLAYLIEIAGVHIE